MNWRFICIATILSGIFSFGPGAVGAPKDLVDSELPWHEAVVDGQGQLLAWYQPQNNLGYDKVLHLAWDFMEHKVPDDPKSGLKIYLAMRSLTPKRFRGLTGRETRPAPSDNSSIRWSPGIPTRGTARRSQSCDRCSITR